MSKFSFKEGSAFHLVLACILSIFQMEESVLQDNEKSDLDLALKSLRNEAKKPENRDKYRGSNFTEFIFGKRIPLVFAYVSNSGHVENFEKDISSKFQRGLLKKFENVVESPVQLNDLKKLICLRSTTTATIQNIANEYGRMDAEFYEKELFAQKELNLELTKENEKLKARLEELLSTDLEGEKDKEKSNLPPSENIEGDGIDVEPKQS